MEFLKGSVLLAVALGTQERCREDIDKKYEENRHLYQKIYEISGITRSKVFDRHSVTTSEYIKKVYSIILDEHYNNRDIFITKLIKKAYKSAYTYYTHRNDFVLEMFVDHEQRKAGGLEKLSGIYLDYCFYVMFYLSITQKNKLLRSQLWQTVDDQYKEMLADNELESGLELFLKDDLKFFRYTTNPDYTGYEEFLDKITYKGVRGNDVTMVFESLRLKEEMEIIDSGFIPLSREPNLKNMPMTKITNTLYVILRLFGIEPSLVNEITFSDELLVGLVKYLHVLKNAQDLSDREVEVLFLASLMLHALAKEYNSVRKDHYENLKTQLLKKELEDERAKSQAEMELHSELNTLESRLIKVNKRLKDTQEGSKRKDKEIKSLEVELKRTKIDLDKAKSNDKELQFLRKFYFDSISTNTKESDIKELSLEDMTEALSSIKGVIVGGHQKLQNKLKEQLPNFSFIATDEVSRNISFIKNKDIIFFYAENNNHSIFRKVMAEVEKSDVILSYLEGVTNIDLIVKDIYDKTTKEGLLMESLV